MNKKQGIVSIIAGSILVFNLLITASLHKTQSDFANASCKVRKVWYQNNQFYHAQLQSYNEGLYKATKNKMWSKRADLEKGFIATLPTTWLDACGNLPSPTKAYVR